jgi:hypothetical protein
MANAATTTKQPNLYELAGDGIQITYSTTSLSGQPQFNYHDANVSRNYSGSQIQAVDTEAGTVVSVVTVLTVDSGSTTFSVLIPRVNLRFSDSANINTYGITALHKFSIIGLPSGQQDFYTTHQMQGTAAFVVF